MDDIVEKVIEVDQNDDLYIPMLTHRKEVYKGYIKKTYNELKQFILDIFERDRVYMRIRHYSALMHNNRWRRLYGDMQFETDISSLKDKKIVLYGAGACGRDYYSQLYEAGCNIVLWADKDWEKYKNQDLIFLAPHLIKNTDYDVILIAVITEKVANEIKKFCIDYGVAEEKIKRITRLIYFNISMKFIRRIIMPKVSIIIPVYNVEKYLRKCLDSCINQTFKDIEIIVVNDCSPDNSEVIMREYEQKYPEIVKCIYLDKNIKLGGARNRGIEIAQGQYIMFVDSDDWIAENMCEEMYNSAKKNNADLVFCDLYKVQDEVLYRNNVMNAQGCHIDIKAFDLINNGINVIACNKLYKKELIISSDCLFPEHAFYEDNAVVWIWVFLANKINYVNKPFYYYLIRENSITNEPKNVKNRIQTAKALIIFLENAIKTNLINMQPKFVFKYVFKFLYNIIIEFLIYYKTYNHENLIFLKDYINENIINWKNEIERIDLEFFEINSINNFLTNPQYMQIKNEENQYYFSNLHKKLVAVWGNGVWGKYAIAYLKQFDIVPEFIIDSNSELHGTYTPENIPIVSFEEAKDNCDTIIVAIKNENVYEEIKEQVNKINPNIEVKHFIELFTI